MKITDVGAVALNMPLKHASKAGTYKVERRGTIVTAISTDEGLVGHTYLGQHPTEVPEQQKMCEIINGPLKRELVGEDSLMIEHLWKKMYRHVTDYSPYDRVSRELSIQSIACVDVSLYDLAGKALGIPVYKLLGGFRDEVPVVQVQYYQKSENFSDQLEELRKAASEAKRAGFIGIKLKVGALPIEQDVERVRTVREEGGEGFVICTDANHAYSVEEAIRFSKSVEQYSVAYLEEPVPVYDENRDLKLVRDAVDVPIGACQVTFTRIECMEFIEAGAVDVINPDVIRVGGITEWIKIAHMAEYHNVRMTAHACIEATISLFGGVPNTTWVTQQTPVREPFWSGGELVKNALKPRGGYLRIPDVPGIGYEIREEAIEKYRVTQ